MDSNDETFRVWVGCLACYNEGRLNGEWFDASDAPQDMDDWVDRMPATAPVGNYSKHAQGAHEELWCFDIENSPVDGEMSPMDAVRYAELIEDLSIPLDALRAYMSNQHETTVTEEIVEQATENYIGDDDECVEDNVADGYSEDDLPEWARSSFWTIIRQKVEDMRLGGEWYETDGYYFWAR